MSLNRIQKQFVSLITISKANYRQVYGGYLRRRRGVKKWAPPQTVVKIINAVTGEETTAKAYDDSPTTLKRWLKMRNVRAQFADMVIKKNSTWSKLSDIELKDYPVIVRMGRTSFPYLIDHLGDGLTFGKKTTATVFLKAPDNIEYLSLISQKKALLPKIVKVIKKKAKRKKKR